MAILENARDSQANFKDIDKLRRRNIDRSLEWHGPRQEISSNTITHFAALCPQPH